MVAVSRLTGQEEGSDSERQKHEPCLVLFILQRDVLLSDLIGPLEPGPPTETRNSVDERVTLKELTDACYWGKKI